MAAIMDFCHPNLGIFPPFLQVKQDIFSLIDNMRTVDPFLKVTQCGQFIIFVFFNLTQIGGVGAHNPITPFGSKLPISS